MLVLGGVAAADDAFPDPPPEFPVLDEPHHDLFSPHGGLTDRPLLVIFAEFADITFDDVGEQVSTLYPEHDEIDAAYLHDRFFGNEFPSVADYFDDNSRGQLEAPLEHLDAGDPDAACGTLQAFANEVEALRGWHVPEDRAAAWLHETQSIRAQLDCSA